MHVDTGPLAGFRRRVRVLAVLAFALVVVGAASASAGGNFRGKTKDGFPVTFRTTATKVVGFKTTVSADCISPSSGTNRSYVYPVLLPSRYRLAKGLFKITFGGKSSTHITVSGRISGKSASGKLNVRYEKTLGTTPEGIMDIGLCFAKTTWKATKT